MQEGTFHKLGRNEERLYGPKGIIVCGYPPDEQKSLAGALEKLALGDRPAIFASDTDGERTLKELLSSENRYGMNIPSALPRAIIMSGFTQAEVHLLMGAYRQAGLPRQLWATLTPVSETWSLGRLLKELAAEARAMSSRASGTK